MKTNTLSLLLFAVLAFFSLNSLAATSTEKDGEILEILIVADGNEVAAAKEALKKSSNSSVKDFAQTMVTDHSKNLEDAKQLGQKNNISPIASVQSKVLQKQGENGLKKLESLQNSKFDVAYMDAMVNGHEALLKAIDDKLLPNASNANLKDFLKATRDTVAQHLQMGKDIQSKL